MTQFEILSLGQTIEKVETLAKQNFFVNQIFD